MGGNCGRLAKLWAVLKEQSRMVQEFGCNLECLQFVWSTDLLTLQFFFKVFKKRKYADITPFKVPLRLQIALFRKGTLW